jgi:hypothetical protein
MVGLLIVSISLATNKNYDWCMRSCIDVCKTLSGNYNVCMQYCPCLPNVEKCRECFNECVYSEEFDKCIPTCSCTENKYSDVIAVHSIFRLVVVVLGCVVVGCAMLSHLLLKLKNRIVYNRQTYDYYSI